MKCPTCNTVMQIRNGMYGEFYFCPNQHKCGQKTITKNKPVSVTHTNSCRSKPVFTVAQRTNLWDTSCDVYGNATDFGTNELGDPHEDSGFWENEGDWFRPYG